MPTYKNESRSYVCTHGFSWAPGESKRVPFVINDPRLTETDSGFESPVLVGETVPIGAGEDKEYVLPNTSGAKYKVSVLCLSGSAEVRMNSKTANPAPLSRAGTTFEGEYPAYMLSKLIITGASAGTTVSVYIELINYNSF